VAGRREPTRRLENARIREEGQISSRRCIRSEPPVTGGGPEAVVLRDKGLQPIRGPGGLTRRL